MTKCKEVVCPDCNGHGFITYSSYDCEMMCDGVWAEKCGKCHGAGVIRVPMTNEDKIKKMSVGELTDFLTETVFYGLFYTGNKNETKREIFRWLQQECD